MAGGTFKLSQPKVRPGVYANLKNGRQPTASGSARGTASIPLIGYDWGPRGKWIIISADSPDGHVAELVDTGRSVGDSMYLNIGLQAVDSAEKFYISIVAR